MKYYDVLYGELELDDIIGEILENCWEVRRLKNFGLMNFRSITMLALTHSSRLEHVIGTSYLAQRFAVRQSLNKTQRDTLIASALFHDIDCASFGHSVEWALNAMGHIENHELSSIWTMKPKVSAVIEGRPAFLDSKPFDPSDFNLDKSLFEKFQKGEPGFTHIKSQGMDLDNIDNVFRMAHYMGVPDAIRENVFLLIDGLKLEPYNLEFSIVDKAFPAAVKWHRLREAVYRKFIYDPEYLSFECQIFELISSLAAITNDSKGIGRVKDLPDDVLLWQYFIDDSLLVLRPLLRRLIALDSYNCLFIGSVGNRDVCNTLPSVDQFNKFKNIFVSTVSHQLRERLISFPQEGPITRWIRIMNDDIKSTTGPFHIHITTDKRKTMRKVNLLVKDNKGNSQAVQLGEDGFFVVAALFSEIKLSVKERDFLIDCFNIALSDWIGNTVKTEYPLKQTDHQQLSLEF